MKESKKIVLLVLLLGVAFFMTACGGGGGGGVGNPVAPAANSGLTGSVSGVVTFDGKPMSESAVYLMKPSTALNQGLSQLTPIKGKVLLNTQVNPTMGDYRTMTDANGKFSFPEVLEGEYTLVAIKDSKHQTVKKGLIVAGGPNASVTTVDVQLTPTGNIQGIVQLSSGGTNTGGAPEVIVYLTGTSYVAVTDSGGDFKFENVPGGQYEIRTLNFLSGSNAPGATVDVIPAQTVTVPTIVVSYTQSPEAGAIDGIALKNAQNLPLGSQPPSSEGIIVQLENTYFIAFTDKNGAYHFSNITPGTYNIVFPSDYLIPDKKPSVTVNPASTADAGTVTLTYTVAAQPISTGTTVLGGLTGKVFISQYLPGDSSGSVQISAQLIGPNGNSVTYPDTTGAFAFSGLPVGQYNLEFFAPNYLTASLTPIVVSVASPSLFAGVFQLIPGVNPPVINTFVSAGNAVSIGGANFDPNGDILANGIILPAINRAGWTSVAIQGDISALTPGLYSLSVKNTDGNETTASTPLEIQAIIPVIDTFAQVGLVLNITGSNFDTSCTVLAGAIPLNQTAPGTSTALSADLNGLPPGNYQISVSNPSGSTGYASTSLTIPMAAPAPIQNPIPVASISHQAIVVDWLPVADAQKYQVFEDFGGGSISLYGETFDTTFTVSGLTPGNTYNIGVRGVTADGFEGSTLLFNTVTTKSSIFTLVVDDVDTGLASSGFGGIRTRDGNIAYMRYPGSNCIIGRNLSTGAQTASSTGPGGGQFLNLLYGNGAIYSVTSGSGAVVKFNDFSLAGYSQGSLNSPLSYVSMDQNPANQEIVVVYTPAAAGYIATFDANLTASGPSQFQGPLVSQTETIIDPSGTNMYFAVANSGLVRKIDLSNLVGIATFSVGVALTDFVSNSTRDRFAVIAGASSKKLVEFDSSFTPVRATFYDSALLQIQYDGLDRLWMLFDDGFAPPVLQVIENGKTFQYFFLTGHSLVGMTGLGKRVIDYDTANKKMAVFTTYQSTIHVFSFDASYSFGG